MSNDETSTPENPYRTPVDSQAVVDRSSLHRELTLIFVLWGILACGMGALTGLVAGDLFASPRTGPLGSVYATVFGALIGAGLGVAAAHVFSSGIRSRMRHLDEQRRHMNEEVSNKRHASAVKDSELNPYGDAK